MVQRIALWLWFCGVGALLVAGAAEGLGCAATPTATPGTGTSTTLTKVATISGEVATATTMPIVTAPVAVVTAVDPPVGLTLSTILLAVGGVASLITNVAQAFNKSGVLNQNTSLMERIASLNRLLPPPTASVASPTTVVSPAPPSGPVAG